MTFCSTAPLSSFAYSRRRPYHTKPIRNICANRLPLARRSGPELLFLSARYEDGFSSCKVLLDFWQIDFSSLIDVYALMPIILKEKHLKQPCVGFSCQRLHPFPEVSFGLIFFQLA